jgi:hypothetical protein
MSNVPRTTVLQRTFKVRSIVLKCSTENFMRLWVHHTILVVTTKVTPKHTHLIGVALHFEITVHPKRRVPTVAHQPIINVGRGVGTGTNNGHGVVHVVARAIRNDAGRITTQTRRINPNLSRAVLDHGRHHASHIKGIPRRARQPVRSDKTPPLHAGRGETFALVNVARRRAVFASHPLARWAGCVGGWSGQIADLLVTVFGAVRRQLLFAKEVAVHNCEAREYPQRVHTPQKIQRKTNKRYNSSVM